MSATITPAPTASCNKRWTTGKGEHFCSVQVGTGRRMKAIASGQPRHEGPCVDRFRGEWVEDLGFAAMASNAHLIRPADEAGTEKRPALYWDGTRYLLLGTAGYQHGRCVWLVEDDGSPLDMAFPIREVDLRQGSWSAFKA